jgi:hypothetical protein
MRDQGWIGSERPANAPINPATFGSGSYQSPGGGPSKGRLVSGPPITGASNVGRFRGGGGNLLGANQFAPKADPNKGAWLQYQMHGGQYGGGGTGMVANNPEDIENLRRGDPAAFAQLMKAHPDLDLSGRSSVPQADIDELPAPRRSIPAGVTIDPVNGRPVGFRDIRDTSRPIGDTLVRQNRTPEETEAAVGRAASLVNDSISRLYAANPTLAKAMDLVEQSHNPQRLMGEP